MRVSKRLKQLSLASVATLTMAATFAGLSAETVNGATPSSNVTTTTENFVGKVSYVPGYGINLSSINGAGQRTYLRKLAHGSTWKVFGSKTIVGKKYYNLGGNQWAEAQYIKQVGGTTSIPAPTNKNVNIVTVSYYAGYGISVYRTPGDTSASSLVFNKKLKNGSSWKVFGAKDVEGTTWYNLGGNQWVNGKYVVNANVTSQAIQMDVPYWSQYKPVFAPWGCASTALAMLLDYDGVAIDKDWLKNAQDNLPMYPQDVNGQKGDPYTGKGFGFVINSTGLTKYGQTFDKNVVDISGASTDSIIKIVLSGRPVLYYGYSSYQNLNVDRNRNHDKVIVGYKDGKFLVHDPLYSYATSAVGSGGSTKGGNARFDKGAIAWESLADFNFEYAGRAMTLQNK